ncbi:MAG: MarR family transcriptional regulator [Thermoanaerobaculia bacterium]
MVKTSAKGWIGEFLGSAHIFASAVEDVLERKILDEVAGKQITHSQFRLLKMVELADTQTIRDVAIFLGISNAAASKAVDKLVKKHFLLREEAEVDRREIRLSLTDSSRKILADYDRARDEKLARIFSDFSSDQLKDASILLDRLSAGLVDHHDNPDDLCLQCGIYFRQRCVVRELAKRDCFFHQNRAARRGRVADVEPLPSTVESE